MKTRWVWLVVWFVLLFALSDAAQAGSGHRQMQVMQFCQGHLDTISQFGGAHEAADSFRVWLDAEYVRLADPSDGYTVDHTLADDQWYVQLIGELIAMFFTDAEAALRHCMGQAQGKLNL